MVDEDESGAGNSAAAWLRQKKGRTVLLEVIQDGRWHNAAEIGERLDLSVVSVQRRVAALRDRGLVESHRRRGYRLSELGFEAMGLMPKGREEMDPVPKPPSQVTIVEDVTASPGWGDVVPEAPEGSEEAVEPIDGELLTWLEDRPYRKDLLLAIPADEYMSASELSDILLTSVTAIHGRLKTLKDRGLVQSMPRHGYKQTPLGKKTTEVISAIARRKSAEPEGASAFLSVEAEDWAGAPSVDTVLAAAATRVPSRERRRTASDEVCGLCRADAKSGPHPGWITSVQNHLENPEIEGTKGERIQCRRGVIEDASWFLVVDRNPLAEGHCKLICKEHVSDIIELAEWRGRDQRLAQVGDSMPRLIMLAVEIISLLDDRIVDVMVISGQEVGTHLHFDLIPRYRMDVPGLRPIAAARGHYDDLSLSRKRRLWQSRKGHLEEVADRLRDAARRVLASHGQVVARVTE
jgi:diadenosine tetraphosphate (Ap4A) HIT family hydrolase/biotin operon repressor